MFSSESYIVLAPIFWLSDTFWVNLFSVDLGVFLFFFLILWSHLCCIEEYLQFLCETIWERRVLQICSSAAFSKSSAVCLVAQSCRALCNPVDYSHPGTSAHGDSPGKNTGEGCHAFLQGIVPTQRLNPGLLHGRQLLYRLSHQGRPRILERVAYPFSRGFSPPGNQIFSIAGRFFTSEATSLVDSSLMPLLKHFR